MAHVSPRFLTIYTEPDRAQQWCSSVLGFQPLFCCCMGYTETATIPGISAAGATPQARRRTAIVDAQLLLNTPTSSLPTSPDGFPSPVVITRAICSALTIPIRIFDCGLPEPVPGAIALQAYPSQTAACVSTGAAMPRQLVEHLWQQGQQWGKTLGSEHAAIVIGECVAGGTTTALALLQGLGIDAKGMVNSSHPVCNHSQKQALVNQGLQYLVANPDGLAVAAAVGDPMQPFVAGLAASASLSSAVLLAGGTQMLAVYALVQRLTAEHNIAWHPERIAVGTTRWVAADPSGNTVGLARLLPPVPLLATPLSFAPSRYASLRAYERGYVKEGVGAGGMAIAAALYKNWGQPELLQAIESAYASYKPVDCQ